MFGFGRQEEEKDDQYKEESEYETAMNIKVEETITGKVDRDGKAIELKKEGLLEILNSGSEDIIFDVNVNLENVEGLDLEEQLHIAELFPGKEWHQDYIIEEASEDELPFSVNETINTAPDGDEASTVLSHGHEQDVEFTLLFTFKRALDTVTIEKTLPSGLSDFEIVSSDGEADFEDGKLIWNINDIGANLEYSCIFRGSITVDDIEPKNTGDIYVKYSGEGKEATKLVVLDATGAVKGRTYIESDEQNDAPDVWDNALRVENRSEFPVKLQEIKVYDDDGEYITEVFDEDTMEFIDANGTWVSNYWVKESETIPAFKKLVRYTVLPNIIANAAGSLTIPEKQLAVAYGLGNKEYSQMELASYRDTPVEVTATIENAGSVTFTKLTISDELPNYFADPEDEDISVWIVNEDGEEIQIDADEYDISIESDDIDEVRQLQCVLEKEIKPSEKIILKYTTVVTKPPKDVVFEAKPTAHAELEEPAPLLEIPIEDLLETVSVTHARRKVTFYKEVFPGREKDVYEILIYFKNRGNVVLNNIEIHDLIPSGFTLIEEDENIKSEDLKDTEEGKVKQWIIEAIEEEQEVEIKYTLSGEGDYHGKDLLISY